MMALETSSIQMLIFQEKPKVARIFVRLVTSCAQCKKANRTNSTFGFCRHTSQRRKNQKSCFLPTHGQTNRYKKVNLTRTENI